MPDALMPMAQTERGLIMSKRKPETWVKVMGRLTDAKKRAAAAKRDGCNPDAFNMYMAYSIDHSGAAGAMALANAYIREQQDVFGGSFEWHLSEGRW
jgi:hypothetical protein